MNEDYLIHYGVLGMKWGVRKKQPITSKSTSGSSRKIANAHNRELRDNYKNSKKEYKSAKKTYKQAKKGKIDVSVQDAKKNLNNSKASYQYHANKYSQNINNRQSMSMLGIGKTAQGTYYKARNNGKSKTNAALRAVGKQSAINLGKTAASIAGTAAVTYALSRVMAGGNTSLKQLPVSSIIEVKKFKVKTIH